MFSAGFGDLEFLLVPLLLSLELLNLGIYTLPFATDRSKNSVQCTSYITIEPKILFETCLFGLSSLLNAPFLVNAEPSSNFSPPQFMQVPW